MKEIRCRKCNRLLMRGDIVQVEIKCPKCGYIQNFLAGGLLTENSMTAKKGMSLDYRSPP